MNKDEQALINAKIWLDDPAIDAIDKNKIQDLINQLPQGQSNLTESFYQSLVFGTGGMRAPMGMGSNRLNKYTVRKASDAIAQNLLNSFPNQEIKIVISYDCRHHSKEFSEIMAEVFSGHKIKSILFHRLTPTPILSYAIKYYEAQAGIMITASHNPPKYNGLKVYWQDGGQVVSPIDEKIMKAFDEISNLNDIPRISFKNALSENFVSFTDSKVFESFYQIIKEHVLLQNELNLKYGSELKVIFTPLHGTGLYPCKELMPEIGFSNFKILESQASIDGNFPTVKYPNPEDPEALALAVKEMLDTKSHLVLGTDPDGDRLGVVVNIDQHPHYLTGNQIAVLFLDYILKQRSNLNTLPPLGYVLKSIVTSPMQEAICKKFNINIESTLTGFKWMSAKVDEYETSKPDWKFLFASEESFGYMPQQFSRDKDGVSAIALICEMALYYLKQNKNLLNVLDDLYQEYGFYMENLLSFDFEGLEGKEKINRIMNYYRTYDKKEIFDQPIAQIYDYEDLTLRMINPSSEAQMINSPKSNVLGIIFTNGHQVFLRPSGTEPKIKFYLMVQEKNGNLNDKKNNAKKIIQSWRKLITDQVVKL